MPSLRKPVVAGAFYPAGKEELKSALADCFSDKKFGPGGDKEEENAKLLGGIVPHAGYVYSGPCAARFYSIVPKNRFKTIVIIGPNHTGLGAPVSISPSDFWETPLGKVPVNSVLRERLSELGFSVESMAHAREHSVEVQIPFLQFSLGETFSILPIVIGIDSIDACRKLGAALAKTIDKKRTLLIASSDLNHYESQKETERKDKLALEAVKTLSAEKLYETARKNDISMCGVLPACSVLFALEGLARKAEVLGHYTSGEILPSGDGVVGYSSVAFS
jgi:AmmeMemoRadiSam system protein B